MQSARSTDTQKKNSQLLGNIFLRLPEFYISFLFALCQYRLFVKDLGILSNEWCCMPSKILF